LIDFIFFQLFYVLFKPTTSLGPFSETSPEVETSQPIIVGEKGVSIRVTITASDDTTAEPTLEGITAVACVEQGKLFYS